MIDKIKKVFSRQLEKESTWFYIFLVILILLDEMFFHLEHNQFVTIIAVTFVLNILSALDEIRKDIKELKMWKHDVQQNHRFRNGW